HHPTEIAATLAAAKTYAAGGKIVAVWQPHRFSRLSSLYQEFLSCFDLADYIIVCPIYSAGEVDQLGCSNTKLAQDLVVANNSKEVLVIDDLDQLVNAVAGLNHNNMLVLCMGAGNITQAAKDLPNLLGQINNSCQFNKVAHEH
ncbi:MAG: cyanophycin synthetase, partial [Pseudomonadota bacterium]